MKQTLEVRTESCMNNAWNLQMEQRLGESKSELNHMKLDVVGL